MIDNFIFPDLTSLSIIVICLLFSAFFSSAETAITSLGTLKVKHLIKQLGKPAKPLQLWIHSPGRVITTILLFNNVVNILASSVTTQLVYQYSASRAVGIATGITTFWVLIFGEIIPKSFAKAHAEKVAIFSMKIIQFFYFITYPLIRVLSGFAERVIQIASKGTKTEPLITEEEIEFIVSEGEKAGVIEDIKKDIIEGAFDFDETRVREIMTPRTNLSALPFNSSLTSVLSEIIKTGHSRIPVYRDNIDHIIGVVLAKDLLKIFAVKEDIKKLSVKDIIREPIFAPESQSIMEVFRKLQETQSHMAIIIDEYGGTAGCVTMEDILEEFVGEIQDEFDSEEEKIKKTGTNSYEVAGAIHIDDFTDYFELEEKDIKKYFEDQDADTLAGLMILIIGQMPKPGQKVQLASLNLEVLSVSKRRIQRVKVITSSSS